MKKKNIEKLLKSESKDFMPDVFSSIASKLDIENLSLSKEEQKIDQLLKKEASSFVPNVQKQIMASVKATSPKHKYSGKLIAGISSFSCAALTLAIVLPLTLNKNSNVDVIPDSVSATVSYRVVSVDDNLTTSYDNPVINKVGPTLTLSLTDEGTVNNSSIIAINDPARYVVKDINVSESYSTSEINKTILDSSLQYGYLARTSGVSNVIYVSFASSSQEYNEYLYKTLEEQVIKYFKDNYIYGVLTTDVEQEEIDLSQYGDNEELLEIIYKIYELAKILFTTDDGTYIEGFIPVDTESGSMEDFSWWVDSFGAMSIEQVNTIYTNLYKIQSSITTDAQKEVFLAKLQKVHSIYINNKANIVTQLETINTQINGFKDILRNLIDENSDDYANIDNDSWYFEDNPGQGGGHHGDDHWWEDDDDDYWDDDWWKDDGDERDWDDDDYWDYWEDYWKNGPKHSKYYDENEQDIKQIKREIADLLTQYEYMYELYQKNEKWFFDYFNFILTDEEFINSDELEDHPGKDDTPDGWEDDYDYDKWHDHHHRH